MLARLTVQQARAYNYVQGAVARGLGLNAIQRGLQSTGLGFRRLSILDLIHYVKGVKEAGYTVSRVRLDYFPDVSRIPVAKTMLRRKYSFTVCLGKSGGVDELGNPEYSYVTVTSDKNMRVKDILAEADEYVETAEEPYALEDYAPVVVEARRRE